MNGISGTILSYRPKGEEVLTSESNTDSSIDTITDETDIENKTTSSFELELVFLAIISFMSIRLKKQYFRIKH